MGRTVILAGTLAFSLVAGCSDISAVQVVGEEAPLIERVESLGVQIYRHDQYAAQATDLLIAHGIDLAQAGIRGWITEELKSGCAVTFVAGEPEEWRSAYVVTLADRTEPNILRVDKDLTETQVAMFQARQLALGLIEEHCSDRYNTVVIPRNGEPGWLAYALAATTDPNLVMAGGHYRATVSADGETVLSHRRYTNSCLTLPLKPADMPASAELVAYTMSHLLDNTPTEIHVFLSLLHRMPFYVMTPDGRPWYIADGRIRLLRQR